MKEIVLALILITCAWSDIYYRKIYNLVIGPGIIFALISSGCLDGWSGIINSLFGLATGLVLLIIPFIIGGMGAGDVKLMGLVGAFNGPVFVFYAFIGTALIGGLMAVGILLLKRDLLPVVRNLMASLVGIFFSSFRAGSYEVHSKTALPYGVAIALGTLGAYWVR